MNIAEEIIVYHIVPFLKVKDIVNFCATCKEYQMLQVWDFLLQRDYKKKSREAKERYKVLYDMLKIRKNKIRFEIELDSIEDPLYQLLIGKFTDCPDKAGLEAQGTQYILAEKDISKLDPNHVEEVVNSFWFGKQTNVLENVTDEMKDLVNEHYHLISHHSEKLGIYDPRKRRDIEDAKRILDIIQDHGNLWDGVVRPYDCPICNAKASEESSHRRSRMDGKTSPKRYSIRSSSNRTGISVKTSRPVRLTREEEEMQLDDLVKSLLEPEGLEMVDSVKEN